MQGDDGFVVDGSTTPSSGSSPSPVSNLMYFVEKYT
jgi:hypothetical protein